MWAEANNIPATSVWDALHKPARRPGRAVLAALGLCRVESLYAAVEYWHPEHLYQGNRLAAEKA